MKIFSKNLPLDPLNGVAMLFVLLYDGSPDSIKVTHVYAYMSLDNQHVFWKFNYAESSIRICSVSGLTTSIRIPEYCKQV